MKLLLKSVTVPLTAFLIAAPILAPAFAQATTTPTPSTNTAASYLDYPLARLQRIVPALRDLKPSDDQESLPSILNSVADAIAGLIPQLPDLVSREEVYRSQNAAGLDAPHQYASLAVPGAAGPMATTTLTPQGARGQEFRYLILCHRNAGGITVEESRTDAKGHPVNTLRARTNPLGSGFAYQWLLFSPANQSEFRFRYLGEQEIDGRKTFAIAFAQTPEQVRIPAVFQSDGRQAPYFYQGILWVDQTTSNIVLLRTDLLAPLRTLQLFGLTTELHFRSVQIHDYGQSFWLPSQVHMVITQGKTEIEELHEYTDYRLYHSTATITPAP